MCKKTNIKILIKIESENNNSIILANNKKENKNIFPIQIYMLNSIRSFYLEVKLQ